MRNKYAFSILIFLIGFILFVSFSDKSVGLAIIVITIFSLSNIIYIVNRWCHPKVNKGKLCGKYAEEEVIKKFIEDMK